MELAEALRRRRMVRSFTSEPLSPALLERVLAAAVRAPAAGNTHGTDAVVLEGPGQTAPFWEATTTADWRAASARWPGLRSAPVVVALFTDPGAYLARYAETDKARSGLGRAEEAWPVPYWYVDAGQVVMLLLLAAADAGIGACFLGNFRGEEALRRALGVPADRRYVGAVLLGHPVATDTPSASAGRPRRPVGEVFHRGTW